MAEFVSAQGQLGDVAAPTTMITVTGGKTMTHQDIIFFNTDIVGIIVTLYEGAKATDKKIWEQTIPAAGASGSTVPLIIKQRFTGGTKIDAEAESGKGNKVNYFLTGLEE